MRQLKNFMRNRKAEMLGCGPCVCRTLQCWRYASENCGCGEGVTEEMINSILNWFESTPVYNDLTPEEKEQALADAQEILEGAGDGIAPFYNAVRQGRTFADYVEKMGLDVDESGPCDSSLYEDEEAFIIYISTAGAIHCKYLALVARRGKSPTKELINKEAISDYLDWVTTEMVTYQFKDWDDEILKFGSVKKGETPEAPEDPTRAPTEQYIYTFAGWNPTVGPINRDTTYSAVYSSTVNTYTVTFDVNDADYGSVSPASVANVPYGTAISSSDNVITVGETTVTATASEGYQFSSWGTLPATVTGNVTITATFEQSAVPVNIIWDTNASAGEYADPTLNVISSITAGNSISYGFPDKGEDYYMDAVFYADAHPSSYEQPTGVISFYDENLSKSLWRPISNVEYDQEYPTKFLFNYFLPDFTWLGSTDGGENYDEITSWNSVPEVSNYYMTLGGGTAGITVDFQAIAGDSPAVSDDHGAPIISLESGLVFDIHTETACYEGDTPLFKLENLSESIASYISLGQDGFFHVTAGITSQKQGTANGTLYMSDGEGGMMRLGSIYLGITINPA